MKITALANQHSLPLPFAGDRQGIAERLDQCLDVVRVGSKRQVELGLLAQRTDVTRTLTLYRQRGRIRTNIKINVGDIDKGITGPATNVGIRQCTAGMR